MAVKPEAKAIGIWTCTALVVGNMIGSGVFVLPASLAPYGVNSLWGWVFTVCGAMMLALVFGRLARSVRGAGGPYAYPKAAFGEFVGYLVAWTYWMSIWVGNAAIAIGTTAYLADLIPAIKSLAMGPALATVAMLWVLTFINYVGTRTMGAVQMVTTVLKLLPLAAVGILGIWLFGTEGAAAVKADPQPFSMDAVTAAALLALWGLLGLETATVPADKVIDPETTIPRATVWGTLATGIIYIVACGSVVLLLPTDVAAHADAPFAELIRQHIGAGAAATLALFAFISGFGALNGWVLVQADMPRVLAENGVFPKLFARQTPQGTPGVSLLITTTLVSILVLMNSSAGMVEAFTKIVLVSTAANLVMYLMCGLAALKLTRDGLMTAPGASRSGTYILSILASAYALWTFWVGNEAEAMKWCVALIVAGVPVYALMKMTAPKLPEAAE